MRQWVLHLRDLGLGQEETGCSVKFVIEEPGAPWGSYQDNWKSSDCSVTNTMSFGKGSTVVEGSPGNFEMRTHFSSLIC